MDADRLAALEALAAVALPWYRGRASGLALQDVIRQHLAVLDPDPGRTLAWTKTDPEPVAGVDYLPADVEDFDRNDAGTRRLREFGLELDPVNSFDPLGVAA
jgi:hypothetical protein